MNENVLNWRVSERINVITVYIRSTTVLHFSSLFTPSFPPSYGIFPSIRKLCETLNALVSCAFMREIATIEIF